MEPTCSSFLVSEGLQTALCLCSGYPSGPGAVGPWFAGNPSVESVAVSKLDAYFYPLNVFCWQQTWCLAATSLFLFFLPEKGPAPHRNRWFVRYLVFVLHIEVTYFSHVSFLLGCSLAGARKCDLGNRYRDKSVAWKKKTTTTTGLQCKQVCAGK